MFEQVYWVNCSYWPILNLHAISVRDSPALDILTYNQGSEWNKVQNVSAPFKNTLSFPEYNPLFSESFLWQWRIIYEN